METNYSKEFISALQSGEVIVRKVFANANKPEQVTVQFMQELPDGVGQSANSNNLVAEAQGININRQRVTALFSFKKEVIAGKGIPVGTDLFAGTNIVRAKDLFSNPVNIEVTENTTKNPFVMQQNAKVNPNTGETLYFEGKPIYRHTQLVEREAIHEFLAPSNRTGTAVSEQEQRMTSTVTGS